MATFLRALSLLSIMVWVGGIGFFAFVLAPVAFSVLPSAHEAGMVVRGSILILHTIGIACGTLFLVTTFLLRRRLSIDAALILAMLTVTLLSQFAVLPRMERDRATAGGVIETLPQNDPTYQSFDRLHSLSERMEGTVLLLGLLVVVLMARGDADLIARSASRSHYAAAEYPPTKSPYPSR